MTDSADEELLSTALHDLHVELGARMVPFAGYDMPVQYEGVVAEHIHTRTAVGLFDVAHMGVIEFGGDVDAVGAALERVLPSAISTLKPGRQRYSFLTNERGGVIDDLMVTRHQNHYTMVVNASRKHVDLAHLQTHLPDIDVTSRPDLALLAIQGPGSPAALGDIVDADSDIAVQSMAFMDVSVVTIDGVACGISRSGYTGEDGYELTVPSSNVEGVARTLLGHVAVRPIGLGARDTLRLEAGLCLYGNDLTEDISPVEADLVWAMQKRRREQGGFVGSDVIQAQLAAGVDRIRVGIKAEGRRPVRDHSALLHPTSNIVVGEVTSGGFGPTVEGPVAMGYVPPDLSDVGTELVADVRGKPVPVTVATLPFTPHGYYRG